MIKFIKINKIHTNIIESKLTLLFAEKNAILSIQNQFKNRTLRFRFLQTLNYLPIFQYDATNF